jgi:hypothetical protein
MQLGINIYYKLNYNMMSIKSNELTDMYPEKNTKSFHTVMNSETRHRVWTGNFIY